MTTQAMTSFGIPKCKLDHDAKQKYVLVKVGSEYLVRGNKMSSFHADVAEHLTKTLDELSLEYKVIGGGRIIHSAEKKEIVIYGYSIGFPWENDEHKHDISAEVVKTAYPEYNVQVDATPGLY